MAADSYVELLRLGPFGGVDYTTSSPLVQAGYAVSANNANPTRKTGALMCERGRQTMFDFKGIIDDVTMLYSCVGRNNEPYVIVQGFVKDGLVTLLYDINTSAIQTITNALQFTQAVQFGEVVYTNAGQRFFFNPLSTQFYDWQYPAPMGADPITLSSGTGTNLLAGTYFYVLTRQTVMPDRSISETSVDLNMFENPPSFTLGSDGAILITRKPGFDFVGTNDDGTTFTTNLYRQSSNQAGYLLVKNLTTNSPYNDDASDIALLANQELEVSRDPPPVSEKNLGWLAIHNSAVWCFVLQDTSATFYIPEVQLWYSNFARPWEFDATAQVLLCQSDVTSAPGRSYFDKYGNDPMGVVEVGTILLAITRRQTWGVYGASQSDYFQRQLFNIGAVAPHSIMPVSGGAYWLSDAGVYFFDGSTPQPHVERFTDLLRGIPGWPASPGLAGIAVADQVQACASSYNLTYYLHFPTLQKTYGYHAPSQQWLGELPYAPRYPQTLCMVAANPTSVSALTWNEVLVARADQDGVPTAGVDWYFADQSFDLGAAQTCSWNGPTTFGPQEGNEKQYRYLTLTGPIQEGSAIVTLTVDPGIELTPQPHPATKQIVWTIPDLSAPSAAGSTVGRQIKTIGADDVAALSGILRGFSANLSVVLTGAEGQPAPQLWTVVAWGTIPSDRHLVPRG